MKALRMIGRWLGTVRVDSGREEFADAIVRGPSFKSDVANDWSRAELCSIVSR